ncbi:hypothetical protein AAG570_004016 [Ranatra chinensis]|uniref:Uncharacterized protein n=1 Tax=Ranatra chinensis TaxID=642074 RepID=A0ABD0Y2M3_9HEMI
MNMSAVDSGDAIGRGSGGGRERFYASARRAASGIGDGQAQSSEGMGSPQRLQRKSFPFEAKKSIGRIHIWSRKTEAMMFLVDSESFGAWCYGDRKSRPMNFDLKSTAEDGEEPNPVRTNELRTRDLVGRTKILTLLLLLGGIVLSNAQRITSEEDKSTAVVCGSDWRNLLQEAAFQTLTKYTGYTSSLDDKLQRDSMLWDRIQTAHFLRKTREDLGDRVKTGTLSESQNGEYRFEESGSMRCPGKDCWHEVGNTILAHWKVQKVEPDSFRIHIKVPFTHTSEDIYRYLGDKQVGHFENPSEKPDNPEKRLDNGPYVLKFVDIGEKGVYYPTAKPTGNYYTPAAVNWHPEFNPNSQTYDGFIPSVGPPGVPNFPFYKNIPIYVKPKVYNSDFVNEYRQTLNRYFQNPKIYEFRPSAEFVRYSEPDPLYASEGQSTERNYKYVTDPYSAQQAKYQEPVYVNLPPEDKQKDEKLSTSKIENEVSTAIKTEIVPKTLKEEPEKSRKQVEVSEKNVTEGEQPINVEKKRAKTESKDKLVREKTHLALSYLKWGQRIKTTTQITPTTDSPIEILEKVETQPTSEIPEFNNTNLENQSVHEEGTKKSDEELTEDTINNEDENKNKNIEIKDVSERTPEEIVTVLTTLGFHDDFTTQTENKESTEGVEKSGSADGIDSSLEDVGKGENRSRQLEENVGSESAVEPVSLIVSRISHSYSYKTSKGHVVKVKRFVSPNRTRKQPIGP